MWSDHHYAAQGLKAIKPSCVEYLPTQFTNARLFVTQFTLQFASDQEVYLWKLLHIQSCQKYIPSPSLNTYYHTDAMHTSSLFPWFAAYSLILYAKFGGVKFRKDRVKMQIWGKPAMFFSLAMSVHNDILLGRALSYHKQETGCIYVNNVGPWNAIMNFAILNST